MKGQIKIEFILGVVVFAVMTCSIFWTIAHGFRLVNARRASVVSGPLSIVKEAWSME